MGDASLERESLPIRAATKVKFILTVRSADMSSFKAFQRLNAVSVPKMVGVPKNAEEDRALGN